MQENDMQSEEIRSEIEEDLKNIFSQKVLSMKISKLWFKRKPKCCICGKKIDCTVYSAEPFKNGICCCSCYWKIQLDPKYKKEK